MLHDLTLAWKRLRNSPGFALVAIVTLALAVGANTAIFTVADAVLFRPLPYDDPDRLFVVRKLDRTTGLTSTGVPYDYVAAIQRAHSGVEGVALRSTTVTMEHAGANGGEFVEFAEVAPDYFQILGVRAARGRLFEPADAAEPGRRILLSYESWRTRFGADESIIGRSVTFGTRSREVVGVLPDGFIFPTASFIRSNGLTGSAEFAAAVPPPDPLNTAKRSRLTLAGISMDAVVRLRDGVSQEQAQAELDVIVAGITLPERQRAQGPVLLEEVRSVLFPTGRDLLLLLLGSAGLVLLIGCANLSNMLLARIHQRTRDLVTQAALGAAPFRLIRQILFEATLIGAAAGLFATLLTAACIDVLLHELPPIVYGRAVVRVDGRVAMVACGLGILAGIVFAVWPAWQISRRDMLSGLRLGASSSLSPRWRGRPLVVGQIALAVVLVVGAVAAGNQFRRIANQPLGLSVERLVVMDVSPHFRTPEEWAEYLRRALAAVRRHPEVLSAGAASSRPFDTFGAAEGGGSVDLDLPVVHMRPGFLETLNVQVQDGRLPDDDASPQGLEPVVLTASAAQRLFPDRRAVGQTIPLRGRHGEVVAVVNDVVWRFENDPLWIYSVPRASSQFGAIVVRTGRKNADVLNSVRQAVVAETPSHIPVKATWLADSIGTHTAYQSPRFQTVVFGGFGLLALGLATLGIFAIVAATTALRTRELGIRLAIGASPRALVRATVLEMAIPIVLGVLCGAGMARVAAQVLRAHVTDLADASFDVVVLTVAVVISAGLVAAYLPARRAARVDPIVVLRAE